MKIEQLIVQYLYSNKKVILQEIGAFEISNDINIPVDSEKDTILPENTIVFTHNPKASIDDGLITFIVENTRKIKPLATSDLESFIGLNKQFLNIGKPLIIEGLGTLIKTQNGDLSFLQATTSHIQIKEQPKLITEKQNDTISFTTAPKATKEPINKKLIFGIVASVFFGVISFFTYKYFTNKSHNTNDITAENIVDTAITTHATNVTDTLSTTNIIDTSSKINTANIIDSNIFYVVIKEYQNLAIAQKRLNTLTSYGNKLVLTTKDSVTYKMRMPFKLPITDTLKVRDSLNKFFQAKTYIELP
ncbi:MAG: hypothetical protein ABL929_10330 [Ferruginibacter sp.]|nr:hypothetical protein [Ferruginibacter sp.]